MAKIKVRSGRGTGIIEVDDNASKWAGSEFKKIQAARKESSKDKYVTVGRGTGTIKFGDIPSTKTTSTKGMWVSSGRGTGKRKL
ncbi:MAG: hypothetical protein OEM28_03015 [Nitrosopumilus sp.]|nr:hypothetical protein [Nitrosopumilus sp.]MDH3488022.1 hypothetical protein [Nitrosopumilus sp.]